MGSANLPIAYTKVWIAVGSGTDGALWGTAIPNNNLTSVYLYTQNGASKPVHWISIGY